MINIKFISLHKKNYNIIIGKEADHQWGKVMNKWEWDQWGKAMNKWEWDQREKAIKNNNSGENKNIKKLNKIKIKTNKLINNM